MGEAAVAPSPPDQPLTPDRASSSRASRHHATPVTETQGAPGAAGRPGARTGLVSLAGLALVGIGLRAWVMASPLGYLNSDEAHTSIQARELFRGHVWILVPGNPYGGNFEAWLDAPLAALFGLSATRNKVEAGVFWLVAALVLARSVRHLGRGPVAAAFGVLWLPSAALVLVSTLNYPGYPFGLVATCGALALARPLLDNPPLDNPPAKRFPVVSWRAGAVGFLAGLAVWQHPLYGWVCGATLAVLAWHQRRRLARVIFPMAVGGIAALTPMVVANLRHDLLSLRFRSAPTEAYPDRVSAWIIDLYPRAMGARWRGPGWVDGRFSQAVAALVLVLLVAVCLAVLRRSPLSGKVAAGTLLLAPFVLTLLGNTSYTLDGRYAVMVLPAAALTLAHGVALLPRRWPTGLAVPFTVVAWAVLAVVVPFRDGIGTTLTEPEADLDQLVAFLDARQITAARADYWVAYRLVVRSDERIAASPLAPVKFDRYEQRVRQADAMGAGVLVLETAQVAAYPTTTPPVDFPYSAFPQFQNHQRVAVGSWTVFLPPGTPAAPKTGRT